MKKSPVALGLLGALVLAIAFTPSPGTDARWADSVELEQAALTADPGNAESEEASDPSDPADTSEPDPTEVPTDPTEEPTPTDPIDPDSTEDPTIPTDPENNDVTFGVPDDAAPNTCVMIANSSANPLELYLDQIEIDAENGHGKVNSIHRFNVVTIPDLTLADIDEAVDIDSASFTSLTDGWLPGGRINGTKGYEFKAPAEITVPAGESLALCMLTEPSPNGKTATFDLLFHFTTADSKKETVVRLPFSNDAATTTVNTNSDVSAMSNSAAGHVDIAILPDTAPVEPVEQVD